MWSADKSKIKRSALWTPLLWAGNWNIEVLGCNSPIAKHLDDFCCWGSGWLLGYSSLAEYVWLVTWLWYINMTWNIGRTKTELLLASGMSPQTISYLSYQCFSLQFGELLQHFLNHFYNATEASDSPVFKIKHMLKHLDDGSKRHSGTSEVPH